MDDELDLGLDGLPGTDDDPMDSFGIPDSVLRVLGEGATVQDLLDLANAALGAMDINAASLSEINAAVDAINRGFDECRVVVSCGNPAP